MPEVSVIVPARNAEATLPRTLEALAQQDGGVDYEVIVVDDGSTDRTADLARTAPGPVQVLQQEPQGPADARNLGVAASTGRALAFCDADVFPTPGWLRAGLDALEAADLVQGRVLPVPDTPLGPYDRTIWILFEVGLWETANLFTHREVFDRTGGFEAWLRPEIGKDLAEDVWFGWKARRLGARSAFAEDALAYHAVFQRSWHEYVGERRRLRYFPAMAAKMPELRGHFFFRRVFLSKRTAALDLAVACAALALARRSPLPLLGAVPYGIELSRRPRRFGGNRLRVATVDVLADLVGLASLLRGSVRYRSPVL